MDQTKEIASLLEDILLDDYYWNNQASSMTKQSELYRWRRELEPILNDIAWVRKLIEKEGQVSKLIEQRRHMKKELYMRLFDWATYFDSLTDLQRADPRR